MAAPIASSLMPPLALATLYVYRLAQGATPDIFTPSGSSGAGVTVLSIVLPAAVLLVCTPWPWFGAASGLVPVQVEPLLALQSRGCSFGEASLKPQVASFVKDGWPRNVPVSITPTLTPSPRVAAA